MLRTRYHIWYHDLECMVGALALLWPASNQGLSAHASTSSKACLRVMLAAAVWAMGSMAARAKNLRQHRGPLPQPSRQRRTSQRRESWHLTNQPAFISCQGHAQGRRCGLLGVAHAGLPGAQVCGGHSSTKVQHEHMPKCTSPSACSWRTVGPRRGSASSAASNPLSTISSS